MPTRSRVPPLLALVAGIILGARAGVAQDAQCVCSANRGAHGDVDVAKEKLQQLDADMSVLMTCPFLHGALFDGKECIGARCAAACRCP